MWPRSNLEPTPSTLDESLLPDPSGWHHDFIVCRTEADGVSLVGDSSGVQFRTNTASTVLLPLVFIGAVWMLLRPPPDPMARTLFWVIAALLLCFVGFMPLFARVANSANAQTAKLIGTVCRLRTATQPATIELNSRTITRDQIARFHIVTGWVNDGEGRWRFCQAQIELKPPFAENTNPRIVIATVGGPGNGLQEGLARIADTLDIRLVTHAFKFRNAMPQEKYNRIIKHPWGQ